MRFPPLPDTRTVASTRRCIAVAVIAVAMIAGLSGCFGFGPSLKERASHLEASLEEGGLRVTRAEATAPASFSGSLIVTVILEADVLESGPAVSADGLEGILRVVGREATGTNVGYAILYTQDGNGADVSTAEAARQLGLSETGSDGSLSLSKAERGAFAAE